MNDHFELMTPEELDECEQLLARMIAAQERTELWYVQRIARLEAELRAVRAELAGYTEQETTP
jgi:DNA-binding GntR family transcriptional regulator